MNHIEELNKIETEIIPTAERGKIAFELEQKVKELQHSIGSNFLEMGKVLKEIRDNQYYRELGYDTITDWLQERSISAGWAWNFINIYEIFILEHKLSPARVLETDYSKLSLILPIVKRHPDQVDDWLTKAENLRRIDLRREIMDFKHANHPEEMNPLKQGVYISLFDLYELLHYLIAIKELFDEKKEFKKQLQFSCDYLINMIKHASGIEDENKYLDIEKIKKIKEEK